MLLNNFEEEIRFIMKKEGMSQADIGRALGVSRSAVAHHTWERKIVNDGLLRIMDVLGYDVKVVYVKRKEEKKPLPDYIIEEK